MITIADNASRDQTWGIACRLANQLDGVRAVHLDQKGRGRALRAAWSASPSPVVAYMDVDLSTDLDALLPLVAPLLSGHSDVAIGSRLASGARVVRGPRREVISRSYNLILKATLGNGFTDAQCGFKAVRADVARALLPADRGQRLVLRHRVAGARRAQRAAHPRGPRRLDRRPRLPGRRGQHRPRTTSRGIWRMLRRFAAGEGTCPPGTFPAPGHPRRSGRPARALRRHRGRATTALFAVLRRPGRPHSGRSAPTSSPSAVCAVRNTAANRRVTFSRRGRPGPSPPTTGPGWRSPPSRSSLPSPPSLALGAAGVTPSPPTWSSSPSVNAAPPPPALRPAAPLGLQADDP